MKVRRLAIYSAFVLSGVAGLVYEVVWTRYLSLYVGHSAFAQVLVLAVYLGGMAVGALAVSNLSRRLRRPLWGYAGAEAALAVFGLAFHGLFLVVTDFSYDVLFPAMGNTSVVGAVRWGLATLLVLPPALILGTTFPLMAAGLVRDDVSKPGRGVATAYLANTFGGAFGVVLAGFVLVPRLGLPGTVVGAAVLNAVAAALILLFARDPGVEAPSQRAGGEPSAGGTDPAEAGVAQGHKGLGRLLLSVSFGTALASFAYEIGWIRMLSLVLGSATHSFELMLSAFILGLALGSMLVRGVVDRAPSPLRLLGRVQWLMGLAALATLPFYVVSFEVMAGLVSSLPGREHGYELFNLARYGISLLIMLPATVLAGMTLPLITGVLLRAGIGERSIGWVYGVNTLGSVTGVALAGLVLLPLVGLKGLLVLGAALDMALGAWLVGAASREAGGPARPGWLAAGAGAVVCAGALLLVQLDQAVLTSGVFRYGEVPEADSRTVLYYHDGRTATVGAFLRRADGYVILTTNGKPDASLDPRWFNPRRDTVPPTPIGAALDVTTQVLAPLIALGHNPDARTVANVGHGSGMSGHSLLSHAGLERMVTIEIEPSMVEGSLVYLPANARVFEDPRSSFVFDDAKAFFAYRDERFDLIFSEPSNPWVSGTATLFSREFYRGVRRYLAPGGLLAQWIQLYEIDDELVMSVIAALDESFGSYRGYLVGDNDILIVARADGALSAPDWRVADTPGVREMLVDVPPFRSEHLEALLLFDETTLRPILDSGVRSNSDYHPILEQRAERTRFEGQSAEGFYSLAANRIDLRRTWSEEHLAPPDSFAQVPARGLVPSAQRGLATWLREALRQGGGIAPVGFPEWTETLVVLRDYLAEATGSEPPEGWLTWAQRFDRVERALHFGSAGWVDSTFYDVTFRFLDAQGAPPEAGSTVALMHGIGAQDFEEAALAADVLVEKVAGGEPWVRSTVLLDAAVIAYLKAGRPEDARRTLDVLVPLTQRGPWNLRNRLLAALVDQAIP